jgi:hypothetical protein
VRWRRNRERLRLHPERDGDGVRQQELWHRFERLRRHAHLRLVHLPSDVRWRRNRERLRLHPEREGDGVRQQELRNGLGRLRWNPHLRVLFRQQHDARLCHQYMQAVHSGFAMPSQQFQLH